MRITFLLTQSLESPSGLGRYWPLAKELTRLGHSVTILALHHDFASAKQRHFTREGVTVRYVGQMHVRKVESDKTYFKPWVLLWIIIKATVSLCWTALHTSTDIYHVGKPHPMNSIAGLVASRLQRKPLYLDCDDYEAGSNYFSRSWQRKIVSFCEDHMPRWVQGITVNTHFMMDRLRTLGYSVGNIVYVPNGVDRDRFAPVNAASLAALRQQLGLEGYQVVLYLGSMSLSSHAVDLLLEAFETVISNRPEIHLLMVGGGEDLHKLQEQAQQLGIAKVVHFIGRIASEQVPLYYHLADVTVDPVRDDAAAKGRSPLKLFESWVTGVPCVTADVGDRRFLLGTPPAGVLTSPGSSTAMADALLQLLHDPQVQQTVSALGRKRIKGFFWDILVHIFAEVYNV